MTQAADQHPDAQLQHAMAQTAAVPAHDEALQQLQQRCLAQWQQHCAPKASWRQRVLGPWLRGLDGLAYKKPMALAMMALLAACVWLYGSTPLLDADAHQPDLLALMTYSQL